MKVDLRLAAAAAALLAASGIVVVAGSAQAYGPAFSTLSCRTYTGDAGTGTGASTYTDSFSLTQSPTSPEQGQAVTLTLSGTTGPAALAGGALANSTTMRAVVALSGTQTGTVALASTAAYPTADVMNFLAMGAWSATGSFVTTTPGEVDAALKLVKIDDDAAKPGYSGSNVDRYCSDTATDADFKATGGTTSANIVQPITVTADTTAPTGSASITSTGAWPGGSTTVNLTGVSDDASAPSAIVPTVAWGDGSSPQVLAAGATTANHTFSVAGAHAVTVTLKDGAGNVSSPIAAGTYTVTVPTATYTLAPKSIYATQSVSLKPTSISSDVASVTAAWGDGKSATVSRSKATKHTYAKAGSYTVKLTLHRAGGQTAARTVGTVKVSKDKTAPVVKISAPSKAAHGSSWKTVRGTVTDKGLGAKKVYVTLVEKTGGTYYYFTGSKWLKASSKSAALKKAKRLTATPSANGHWSVKGGHPHSGLTLVVHAWATDKAGNTSKATSYTKRITS